MSDSSSDSPIRPARQRETLPDPEALFARLRAHYDEVVGEGSPRDEDDIPLAWDLSEASYDVTWGSVVRNARNIAYGVAHTLKNRTPPTTLDRRLHQEHARYSRPISGLAAIPVTPVSRPPSTSLPTRVATWLRHTRPAALQADAPRVVTTIAEYGAWVQSATPEEVVAWLAQQPAEHPDAAPLREYLESIAVDFCYTPSQQRYTDIANLVMAPDRVWAIRLKAMALMLMPEVTRATVTALMTEDFSQGTPETPTGERVLSTALPVEMACTALLRRSRPIASVDLPSTTSRPVPVWHSMFWEEAEKVVALAVLPPQLRPVRECPTSGSIVWQVLSVRLQELAQCAQEMQALVPPPLHGSVQTTHLNQRIAKLIDSVGVEMRDHEDLHSVGTRADWQLLLTRLDQTPMLAEYSLRFTMHILQQSRVPADDTRQSSPPRLSHIETHRRVAARHFRTVTEGYRLALRHLLRVYPSYEEAPACREAIIRKFLERSMAPSLDISLATRVLVRDLARWLPPSHEQCARALAQWCVNEVTPPDPTMQPLGHVGRQHPWRRAGDPRLTVPGIREALDKYAQRQQRPLTLGLAADLYVRSLDKPSRRALAQGVPLWAALWDGAPAFRLMLRACSREVCVSAPSAFWSKALQSEERSDREFWIRRFGEVRAIQAVQPSACMNPATSR